jgi:c-di-GMP-binding flagellar brake protein YcgR
MKERRRFKRLPVRGFMDCSVEFDASDKRRRTHVLSISAGGIYIALDERRDYDLTRGVELENIRFDNDILCCLELRGTVAHRMSLGEIGGCGIEFSAASAAQEHILERFVDDKLLEWGLDEA